MSAQASLPVGAAHPQPSPELFFDTINGYQRTQALKTALELDLFTAVAEGKHTAENIALRCQASVRGIRILCDYLCAIGFLAKDDGEYVLTPDSSLFLNRHSPHYIGDAVGFLTAPAMRERWDRLTDSVRKGGTAVDDQGTMAPDFPVWQEFARSMGRLQTMAAEQLARVLKVDGARPLKVLDIAAGHGMFGIAVLRHSPAAEVVAVDWAGVLEVARENAQRAGVADRWRPLPGSAFEVDFGGGYDLALVTGFLHHFDAASNEKLLAKVHRALKPQGRLGIVEFVPNDDRVTPPPSAMFPLTMLASTVAGDAYTFAEYQRMLHGAGYSSSQLHDPEQGFQRMIVAHV
jgi:ubiquinone/menaquinone biosynthesis C-methylase UbiE